MAASATKNAPSLVVKRSRVKPACYLFMGVCLCTAAFLAATQPLPFAPDPTMMRIMTGYVGGAMSVFIVVYNLWSIFRKGSAFVIDERGIQDNSGYLSSGFISWDDIQEVFILRLHDDDYLSVVPKDYDAWFAGLNKLQKRLASANADAGFAPIRIQFKKADDRVKAKDGLEICKALHPEKVTRTRKPKY